MTKERVNQVMIKTHNPTAQMLL